MRSIRRSASSLNWPSVGWTGLGMAMLPAPAPLVKAKKRMRFAPRAADARMTVPTSASETWSSIR